jgi:hypothetical protein
VTPNQKATAVLDAYPDWQIPAHVITTIPTADRQKATVLVRLAFDELDPRVLPDMGVKVAFHGAAQQPASDAPRTRTLVPRTAVRASGNTGVVFVITDGGRAERRAVRVGAEDGDRIEIASGVSPGERVVNSPPADLQDGARVKVKS